MVETVKTKNVIASPKGAFKDDKLSGDRHAEPVQRSAVTPGLAMTGRNDLELETDLQEIKKEQGKLSALTEKLTTRLKEHGLDRHVASSLAMTEESTPQNDKTEYKNTLDRFQRDPDFRNISISGVNAVLHAAATVTNFLVKDDSKFKVINDIFDKSALLCTKWLAPITSYGWSAYEAFKAKQPIKALIKLVPPAFLPFIGDANIDTVYGSSTGFNQPYDLAIERIKERSKTDINFKAEVDEANKTHLGNAKLIWSTFKDMCKEFAKGKMPYKEAIYFVNCIMILGGALPMMLFDRNARDTLPAKVLGTIRSIGGLLGDYAFVTQEWGNLHKLTIGGLCGVSAVASIVKRFVKSDSVARVLIHLGAALDVTAYALWNAFNSGKQNQQA